MASVDPAGSPRAVASNLTAVSAPPSGFSDTVVGSAAAPTALAFAPDGRMVVTGKQGRVFVFEADGSRRLALDITARVCDEGERGLVGVAVDPEFESNRFVYLYYTREVRGSCGPPGPRPSNRVGRFVLVEDGSIDPASEKVIVDHISSPQANHIAGDLEFGENGYLYITVGDGVCSLSRPDVCGGLNNNPQLRRYPHGKVLRVTRNGAPAEGNPFLRSDGARRCTRPSGPAAGAGPCKEIYAMGLRNPFRFARKPGTSRFFVNDVGKDTWEEVNRLAKGRNYGWNVREGSCRRDSTTDCDAVPRFTDPLHAYRHTSCRSITGGAFVPTGLWRGMDESYLFADYACGTIFELQRESPGEWRRTTFLEGADGPVHLRFGPHGDTQALYYLSYFSDTIHRVSASTANAPPVARFTSTPDGTTLSFDGADSSDPDSGDRIVSWAWSFGDGNDTTTSVPTTTHTYARTGPHQVTLVVTDDRGAQSEPVTTTVHSGEHAPSLEITAPPAEATFPVGRELTLRAEATDPEDGPLPGSSLSWELRRRHANHFHPFLGPVPGGSVDTTFPSPETLSAAGNSWLVAIVTATDSRGHTTVVRRKLLPRTVELTFRTSPRRGELVLDGERRRTPATITSWVRHPFVVRAPDQRIDGDAYDFRRWSDGGSRKHLITTPRRPTDYTATFRRG
jgi:glucose/arabinose dehydrogenase/PKD repeat protein